MRGAVTATQRGDEMPNEIMHQLKEQLLCPIHRASLCCEDEFLTTDGTPRSTARMSCPEGCTWPVRGGIPRFVHGDGYAASFGLQWRCFAQTELDSSTGKPYSKQRLERCLGAPLESLRGKVVLECGSGAGRFTELLVRHCESLVSIDLSAAVEANLINCGQLRPYLLLQADINASPLPFHCFDLVICLGVIQHTPSPEVTITNLRRHVKRGGSLVIDHYTRASGLKNLLGYLDLAYPLRAVLRRLKPEHALRATTFITAFCDPIRRQTCKIRALDRVARRVFPTACYYNKYPDLDPQRLYEWHQLDTFDMLTDRYKHFRSPKQIRSYLEGLGLRVASCDYAGNGVEARAVVPL